MTKAYFEDLALRKAEKYGVITYKVVLGLMVYYANYPMEHKTYKVTWDLLTDKENRQPLKKYYKKGNDNMYL